jgi:hypothetical protein
LHLAVFEQPEKKYRRNVQMKKINVGGVEIGGGAPLALIAGPCVIEDEEMTAKIARDLKALTGKLGIPFIFKASYDKANRTSRDAYRGPGLVRGLEILKRIREEFSVPVLSDVHRFEEIAPAAEILDVLQVPAFLCRQTDFVVEIARRAKAVNIKKGQFIAPWDAVHIVEKLAAGNDNIMLTERGVSFGYNNLVVDFRYCGERDIRSSLMPRTAYSFPEGPAGSRAATAAWFLALPGLRWRPESTACFSRFIPTRTMRCATGQILWRWTNFRSC